MLTIVNRLFVYY